MAKGRRDVVRRAHELGTVGSRGVPALLPREDREARGVRLHGHLVELGATDAVVAVVRRAVRRRVGDDGARRRVRAGLRRLLSVDVHRALAVDRQVRAHRGGHARVEGVSDRRADLGTARGHAAHHEARLGKRELLGALGLRRQRVGEVAVVRHRACDREAGGVELAARADRVDRDIHALARDGPGAHDISTAGGLLRARASGARPGRAAAPAAHEHRDRHHRRATHGRIVARSGPAAKGGPGEPHGGLANGPPLRPSPVAASIELQAVRGRLPRGPPCRPAVSIDSAKARTKTGSSTRATSGFGSSTWAAGSCASSKVTTRSGADRSQGLPKSARVYELAAVPKTLGEIPEVAPAFESAAPAPAPAPAKGEVEVAAPAAPTTSRPSSPPLRPRRRGRTTDRTTPISHSSTGRSRTTATTSRTRRGAGLESWARSRRSPCSSGAATSSSTLDTPRARRSRRSRPSRPSSPRRRRRARPLPRQLPRHRCPLQRRRLPSPVAPVAAVAPARGTTPSRSTDAFEAGGQPARRAVGRVCGARRRGPASLRARARSKGPGALRAGARRAARRRRGARRARLRPARSRQDAGGDRSFKRALDRDGSQAHAVFGLAESYRQQGNQSAALATFKRFLKLQPSGSDADIARRLIQDLSGGG